MLRDFGRMPDGEAIQAIDLEGAGGLRLELLTYGGILRRLVLPTRRGPVDLVLSLDDLPAYLADRDHLGTLVGRFGNRIAGGRFELDGQPHEVTRNEGHNHLHGGARGFGQRVWSVRELQPDRLVLGYRSAAGEEGYPGTLEVSASFRVGRDGFELVYSAATDAPTPINLTHHPYFNLAGDPAVPAAAQRLRIPADRYLPVQADLIPTGEIAAVQGTPFDLRDPATLEQRLDPADPQLQIANGFDHCLVLADGAACSAELYSPHSGAAMRITSSMPALQLYDGHALDNSHPGIGRGLCLEPQGYPDAPNHAQFPEALLRPGQTYTHRIEYRLVDAGPDAGWAQVVEALDRAQL